MVPVSGDIIICYTTRVLNIDFNPRIGAQFRLFERADGVDVIRAMHLDLTGRDLPAGRQVDGRLYVVENLDVPALSLIGALESWRRLRRRAGTGSWPGGHRTIDCRPRGRRLLGGNRRQAAAVRQVRRLPPSRLDEGWSMRLREWHRGEEGTAIRAGANGGKKVAPGVVNGGEQVGPRHAASGAERAATRGDANGAEQAATSWGTSVRGGPPRADAVVIGAGPYGLSTAAHLAAAGLSVRTFGEPMESCASGSGGDVSEVGAVCVEHRRAAPREHPGGLLRRDWRGAARRPPAGADRPVHPVWAVVHGPQHSRGGADAGGAGGFGQERLLRSSGGRGGVRRVQRRRGEWP